MNKFVDKMLQRFQQRNKLAITISAFGLILFILLATTLPFKDKIFSLLYKIIPSFAAQQTVEAGTLRLSATFNSIGIELPFLGDDNGNATATLEFKKSSDLDTAWRQGLPLWRTEGTDGLVAEAPNQGQVAGVANEAFAQEATSSTASATPNVIPASLSTPSPTLTPVPSPIKTSSPSSTPISSPSLITAPTITSPLGPDNLTGAFYGSALLLDAGTPYDIKVTVHDPDNTGGDRSLTENITTRADNIPVASSLTSTHFVRTDGDDSSGDGSSAKPWATLQKAIRSAPSGAVVEVGPGFYKGPIQAPSALRDNKITFKAKYTAVNDNREVINVGLHSVIEPDVVAAKGSGTWKQVTLAGPGNNGAEAGLNYKVWKWVNSSFTGAIPELGIAPDHKDIPQRVASWGTDTINLDTPEEWVELMYSNKTYNYGFWRAPGTSDIYMRILDPDNQDHRGHNNIGLNPNNFWVTIGGGGTTSAGIYLTGAGSRISGFEVRQFRNGISITGDTSIVDHNIISGNDVAVRVTGTEDVVIEKNYVADSNTWTDNVVTKPPIAWKFIKQKIITANDLIYPTDAIENSAQTDAFPGRGTQNKRLIMRNNTIDGTFNGAKGAGEYHRYDAIDFDVHDNLIKHIADDAIEPDGAAINYRVWNNRIEDAKTCVSTAPMPYGPLYIFRNQFYKVGTLTGTDGEPGGNCFKYAGDNHPRSIIYIVSNTFWTDIPGVHGGTMAGGKGTSPHYFYLRNNLFRMTGIAFSVDENAIWDEDYNHFATSNINQGLRYAIPHTRTYSTNVQAYRDASSQGAHTNLLGNFITPSVIDNALDYPSTGNLTLQAGAPFIDAGVAVPNISDICGTNFSGAAPDLGATEGVSTLSCGTPPPSPPPPSPAPSPSPSATPGPNTLKITSGPIVKPTNDSATITITWETNKDSSSKVDYGFKTASGFQYIGGTEEVDLSPGVRKHSMVLSYLAPCSKYVFRVQSKIGSVEADNKSGDFSTKGCTGDAGILDEKTLDILKSGGIREVDLSRLKIIVPNLFAESHAFFQAKRLGKDRVIGAHPRPVGFNTAGDNVYRLDAFTDLTNRIQTFQKDLTVIMSYTAEDVAGIEETSLKIHRFDETTGKWEPLLACSVNIAFKTVTCQTNKFSDFALLGASSSRGDLRMFGLGVLIGVLATLALKKRKYHHS